MKKFIGLLSLSSLFLFTSCGIYNGRTNPGVEYPDVSQTSQNNQQQVQQYQMNFRPSNEELQMLDNFPKAKGNQDRYVIWSPQLTQSDEENRVVEIAPFMVKEVDCNIYTLNGSFKEETVEGFGYTYYTYDTNGELSGTLMACPDNRKENRKVYGESKLLRYNSKMPIVVYVPKGVEIESNLYVKE